jgi:hypothetical protein
MNRVTTESAYKSRNWLKLLLLFLATFLVILIGGLAMDILSSATSQNAQAVMQEQSAPIVIDPKLESDLARVMEFASDQNMADLKDPFLDRDGISRNENNLSGGSGGGGGGQTNGAKPTTAGSGGQSGNTKPATTTSQKSSGGQSNPGGSQPSGAVPKGVEKQDTITRILKWDEDIRLGRPVPPINEIIAIEDFLPVGVVSGGNGQDEILLYSQSADRTFSYTVGTRFYDGWLSGIQKDGAVFGYYENRKTFLKSWVRSIQPRSATSSVVNGSLNQGLATGRN